MFKPENKKMMRIVFGAVGIVLILSLIVPTILSLFVA